MLTHRRETLGPLGSILEINVNVKWSMNNERCRSHCAIPLFNVIAQWHLRCLLFMDHLKFAFRASLGIPNYRLGRCTSAIMQRALPRPIPSNRGSGDSTISVNLWMASRCSVRSARHAEVEMTRTLRSLFV